MGNLKKEEKGSIIFHFLTKKYSKCPFCGAPPEDYRKSSYNKWEESICFTCGCRFKSKTPNIIEQTSMCKESKPYKKLKESRLKQLEKVNKFILGNVNDAKLLVELKDKLKSVKYSIERWWD